MKLRNRIVVAVLMLFMIPIICGVLGIVFVTNYQPMEMQAKFGVNIESVQRLLNPVNMVDWMTESSFSEIERYSERSP